MAKLKIIGGKLLKGTVKVSGAKNAALKILPAAILADSPSTIFNVPYILDINRMEDILLSIGAKIDTLNGAVFIDPGNVNSFKPNRQLMKQLRGSIVLVGPLLAKFGEAVFSQPGGCLIGARPIDDHLDVFAQMGVKIFERNGIYHLKGRPKAGQIVLNKMSVTATENAIMASVFSVGTTKISIAAAEPEITDLVNYLNKMGAKIKGAGTHDIEITGVKKLDGADYAVLPDRIEAATYLIAALVTNSELTIGPFMPEHLLIVLKKIKEAGGKFDIVTRDRRCYIKTRRRNGSLKPVNVDTRTYPGFPTDLQSPFAVMMTQAEGRSRIFETIFEGRFLYLSELEKMGAKFEVLSPHIIDIIGRRHLKGKKIACQDIRGGMSLVIGALIADGMTTIEQVEFIDRGYEDFVGKLRLVGADIERIE